jgi:hypothetical protein
MTPFIYDATDRLRVQTLPDGRVIHTTFNAVSFRHACVGLPFFALRGKPGNVLSWGTRTGQAARAGGSVTSGLFLSRQRMARWSTPVEGSGRRAEAHRADLIGPCPCRPFTHATQQAMPVESVAGVNNEP